MSFGGYTLCDAEYSCFPPLFDSLVEQLQLPNKFSICHDAMAGGEMILGGGESFLPTHPPIWVCLPIHIPTYLPIHQMSLLRSFIHPILFLLLLSRQRQYAEWGAEARAHAASFWILFGGCG